MTDELDDKIKEVLGSDCSLPIGDADESLRDLLRTSFRGRMKWLGVIAYLYLVLFGALCVLSALWFFQSDDVKDLILYAGLFGISLLIIVVLKLWYWMLINRNAVTREIKRLELQVARLAERLER